MTGCFSFVWCVIYVYISVGFIFSNQIAKVINYPLPFGDEYNNTTVVVFFLVLQLRLDLQHVIIQSKFQKRFVGFMNNILMS